MLIVVSISSFTWERRHKDAPFSCDFLMSRLKVRPRGAVSSAEQLKLVTPEVTAAKA